MGHHSPLFGCLVSGKSEAEHVSVARKLVRGKAVPARCDVRGGTVPNCVEPASLILFGHAGIDLPKKYNSGTFVKYYFFHSKAGQ